MNRLGQLNAILNLVTQESTIQEVKSDDYRKFPSKDRFEEMKGYLDFIYSNGSKFNQDTLESQKVQALIENLIDVMFKIEYLQNDFNRVRKN